MNTEQIQIVLDNAVESSRLLIAAKDTIGDRDRRIKELEGIESKYYPRYIDQV